MSWSAWAGMVVLRGLAGWSLGHWPSSPRSACPASEPWLGMVRSALHAHDDQVHVRNALTDTTVCWHLVGSVEVRQALVNRTREQVVRGLAVGSTPRQQLRHARRGSGSGRSLQRASLFDGESAARIDYADFLAERLDKFTARGIDGTCSGRPVSTSGGG